MIDQERVRELREEIGEEDFAEVADMFVQEADQVVTRLSAGSDLSNCEADLHALKGIALNLGFAALAEFCHIGERKASGGDLASVALVQICEAYARSRAEFLAL